MKKDIILQVSDKNIHKVDYDRKGLIKKEYILNKSVVYSLDDIRVNIKNKNVFLVIENEEIHVKHLTVPKVENHELNSIVKNRLKYLYGKKSEEIFYSYMICKEEDREIEILVFCINCDKLNGLDKNNIKCKISKVTLIQLCFLNYYQRVIADKDFLFTFKYNNNVYLLAVTDKKIVGNRIVEGSLIPSITKDIDYMFHKINNYNGDVGKIYCVNLNDNEILNYISNINRYEAVDLGFISDEKILEHFIINRR